MEKDMQDSTNPNWSSTYVKGGIGPLIGPSNEGVAFAARELGKLAGGEKDMKAKHTPGPWLQFDNGNGTHNIVTYGGGRTGLAAVTFQLPVGATPDAEEEDTEEANARLIAASPCLLAACETLADYFAGHDPNDIPAECGSGVRRALIQARAAIAKARGN